MFHLKYTLSYVMHKDQLNSAHINGHSILQEYTEYYTLHKRSVQCITKLYGTV